jgi:hypothetical protein
MHYVYDADRHIYAWMPVGEGARQASAPCGVFNKSEMKKRRKYVYYYYYYY